MLIGLVGHIGSGKSEVAEIFKEYGACIISADQIGKEVVENNKKVLAKLVTAFGPSILTATGRLRRKRLGRLAFADQKSKAKLNAIVHPQLLRELKSQVAEARKKFKLVVIDAALLVDWGWHNRADITILVNAGYEIKLRRMLKKGLSLTDAKNRLKSQKSYSDLRRNSDLVILNNKSLNHLKKKVSRIINKLSRKGLTLQS